MAFGKPGRPPEDRLARQREIYQAISPLVLAVGARRLSMEQAAAAACLSIGGLYHYFPTKRDLVLHGLDWAAQARLCHDYRAAITDRGGTDLDAYLNAYLDFVLRMLEFVRPSIFAALELGADDFRAGLEAGLTVNLEELQETLGRLAPTTSAEDRLALARAIRRLCLAAVFERDLDLVELQGQLRTLIEGYIHGQRRTPAPQVHDGLG